MSKHRELTVAQREAIYLRSLQIKAEYNQPFEMKPVKKSGNAPSVRANYRFDFNGLLFAQPSIGDDRACRDKIGDSSAGDGKNQTPIFDFKERIIMLMSCLQIAASWPKR